MVRGRVRARTLGGSEPMGVTYREIAAIDHLIVGLRRA
jgi:hypothetical protein